MSASAHSTPTRRPVRVLDPQIAERIAAGEVIERPASVVKELVENSLDAGATEVCVALEDGGKSLIEITDNGHGMSREDLAICKLRHATSKLQSLADLERIATLGFRGEALPSIAAASELSILSRAADSETAYELNASQAGAGPEAVTFGHFLGSPHGTRLQARALFSQIPARLKFLKAQAAEVSHVREWLERLAMSRPGTGFRLISNERTVLNLKASDEPGRVQSILADGDDFPLLTATNEPGYREFREGEPRVRVHWLQGFSAPQMKRLVQVVNGRAVRDRMLQQAMLAPFRQVLLPGQFPAVAIFIEVDPAELDVNVHPTKTEIRFLDSRKIFSAIHNVIESMIATHGAVSHATSAGAMAFSGAGASAEPMQLASERGAGASFSSGYTSSRPDPLWRASQTSFDSYRPAPTSFNAGLSASQPSHTGHAGAATSPAPLAHELTSARFAGTLFNTYILMENGGETVVIDQHAAHERIRYETLRSRMKNLTPQALLIPEVVKFASDERPRVEERLEWLAQAGFEAEVFGEDAVLFRSVPAEWGHEDLRTRLKNLIERLITMESSKGAAETALRDEHLFEALASEACHSSVRAGDRLEPEEARALVDDLFRTEHPWNCPHGRPTVVKLSRGKIEEWFQRRV